MYTWVFLCSIFAIVFALPAPGLAAGGHDALSCTGCHSLHQAKSGFILAVQSNTKDINPRTKKPYGGTTGICLACHQTTEKGGHGMTPISSHMSHPYGLDSIDPKVARVPAEFMSKGRFECTSCHDPHPSNANSKYLRIDTGGGSAMENFCAVCHSTKSDPRTVAAKGKVFNSMDERAASGGAQPAKSGKKSGNKKD